MTKSVAILLLGSGLLLVGCHDKEREQQLELREQALLEKEKQFALKEADYQTLTRMRDSLTTVQNKQATIAVWPETIAGQWNSKVICTESTCSDYVVGDQRIDIWEFSSDSTQMVTKVISNNKLVRVYGATYVDNQINLSFKTDSTANKQVNMNVLLNEISPNKLRGTRTVLVDNKCTAKFTVELSPATTKE